MFIIAEVGSNWSSFADCKTSVAHAKAYGADAVKFQLFSPEELYGSDIRPLSGVLPREWIPGLAEQAKAYNIEFMCTPFSEDGIKFLNPFVQRHKIASSDLCHVGMLTEAAKSGKPIILSTGGHGITDVAFALDVLKGYKHLTLLYCESSYPAYHTDLRKIALLQEYCVAVGLSDHSRELYSVPLAAKAMGAVMLEKHVNFVGATGPDSPHSLIGAHFREMVKALRGQSDPLILLSPQEQDMVTTHNRRLIAKTDIKAGERLFYGTNYGIFRSTKPDNTALHPALAHTVNGKVAQYDHKKGDPIGPSSAE